MQIALVYPHQLFAEHPALDGAAACVLVEEPLLFSQYRFHALKLALHRSAMQQFAARVRRRGIAVHVAEAHQLCDTASIAPLLRQLGATQARLVDPCDDWLLTRLSRGLYAAELPVTLLEDPHFLTPLRDFNDFCDGRPRLLFADFYQWQRQRLGILLTPQGRPHGGKWSFDTANRRKLPRRMAIPWLDRPTPDAHAAAAGRYVAERFPRARGSGCELRYPATPEQAQAWLGQFLDERLPLFGDYEDAIAASESYLFHSVLTPALNCGLLSPAEVIEQALERADRVPLNSLEGFVRQVIGWREYVRGVYHRWGRRQRTLNFWGHRRPMPRAMYDGTTGIDPVDTVIHRVLQHAYCHHIERLMVLGNFMLLCEIDPDAVYQWFMELFIDAYDWVMVPNVYGMSQFADGGLITTKPYISGSSYVLKMSNFQRGPWCAVWDALYWRFIDRHREFFAGNPRMAVMVAQCERLGSRLVEHHRTAENFLARLHG
ncbi:MAG: cryptochrome/photolyase family protein [Pirellulales bacterium]|nr:cryptochrome/photolyase family protein [Pirellulales bacterium]